MAYLDESELKKVGFKKIGKGVKISRNANIYDPELIELGDYCRIDDFCVISGAICFGMFIHVTPMCLLAGGTIGLTIGDFSTFAYGVKIFTQSDDYSGETMCNSLIPKKYKKEIFRKTTIGRQVIVGAGTTIMPGASIGEGCAIGAMSLVLKPTDPWGVYAGVPIRKIKDRSKKLLRLETAFKSEVNE
ncbi:acyltransferase [Variovorax sp. VRV01]|uniref:acyltransferase n=1 Tax=Variovorax sp. VRV01 TaxID=2769259 RepID=UPI00178152CE|nr:acyltransferase [Variovorax sp. VRV01]MBD9663190.1 acyltransferase [Variovorax sp. VRV01]